MAEKRKTRGAGLTRAKVLAAALEIADAEGLDALSFRRLAARFEVTPMALYRYVENKGALLDGLGDLVLSEIDLSRTSADDWREGLRATARSFRACLVAHPAAVSILLTGPLFTPAAIRTADAVLGLLRGAGFAPDRAALLYQQFARLLLALVMLETGGRPGRSGEDRVAFATLPSDEYPHLAEAAPYLSTPQDAEAAFERGLDLLIAGLDELRPTI